ncbi:MAG: cobalamin-dependent protein [Oligoflexia bacterium]|nr:cobalamin-dependent protein [Oligoflexia bacterium]
MKVTSLLIFCRSKRIKLNVSGYYPMPPLGISMLAAMLVKSGYDVRLLDIDAEKMTNDQVINYLRNNRFDHIGLSANIFSIEYALFIANAIKSFYPDTVISLGGPSTTFQPKQIRSYSKSIDIMVRGEGENSIVAIVKAIEAGQKPKGIPGTIYFDGDEIIETKSTNLNFIDMDTLPLPALELLPPLKNYKMHPPFGVYSPYLYIESARGCPCKCNFCTLPKEYRTRSPELVLTDLIYLVEKFKIREAHFVDPSFTYNKERVMQLCDNISRSNLKLYWTCKTRCDLVDQEMLQAMAAAGCYSISYGVESASQKILDSYRKELTVRQIENCFTMTRKAGIRILAYLMIGAKDESDYTVLETMKMMKKFRADYAIYAQVLPDPCSDLSTASMEKNVFSEKEMLDFYLGGKTGLLSQKGTTGIPAEKIEKWVSKAFNDFYFRPSYVFQRLLDIRSCRDFFNLFQGVIVIIADKLKITKTTG